MRRLAADGAAVAFTYGRSSAEAEKLVAEVTGDGGQAVAIQADSADAHAVTKSVDDAVAALGGLDILVNNAGVAVIGDVEALSLDEFDRQLSINVRAVFVASQRAITHLGEGGRIINIGSINADRVPVPNLSVYAMTKGAVASLTRGLARELGPRGITVNNVQPGPIDTELNPATGDWAVPQKAATSLDRYGHVEEIAAMVAFVAGPESSYITGSNLTVDGGMNA